MPALQNPKHELSSMSNNDILAMYWENDIPQIVIIAPLMWKHHPGGDWFIHRELPVDFGNASTN